MDLVWYCCLVNSGWWKWDDDSVVFHIFLMAELADDTKCDDVNNPDAPK